MKTMFKCSACGKLTQGRVPGRGRGDGSLRYPTRHRHNGRLCRGVIVPAVWVDVYVPAQSPEKIERGLSEGTRYSLAHTRRGTVCAESGEGHTLNALGRRGLLKSREPYWAWWSSWVCTLSPLGLAVSKLAKSSARPGGGKHLAPKA